LARKIQKELFPEKPSEFYAIKATLLRISKENSIQDYVFEKNIEKILKKSSIEIRSNIAVVLSSEGLDVPVLATSSSRSGVMSVIDSSYAPKLKKKGLKVIENLSLVVLYSPPEIQDTPGCITAILDAISSEGINILEFISCHTDTLLVVKNQDAVSVYDILSKLVGDR
jgi:aspartokinase